MWNSALHRKKWRKGKFGQTSKVSEYYEHDCGFSLGDKQRFLEITFRRYLVIILKISVRWKLKELRCELSSSINIISDSEEGGILFLQIAVTFRIKKQKKNEIKRKHRVREFFHKQEEKRPFNNLTINKTSWGLILPTNVFHQHLRYLYGYLLASPQNTTNLR